MSDHRPSETRPAERLADLVVHVVGVCGAAGAVAVLLAFALPTRDLPAILAATVYGGALVATFSLSAAYNLASRPDLKAVLRRFDHATIFVMIAGTYTPFVLISLEGRFGYAMLGIVWLAAIAGALFKLACPRSFERASVIYYLLLGWIGLPIAGVLVAALPVSVLALLLAGGLLYTVGVAFHLWERLPYQNAIWHVFVLTAAGTHFLAVLEVVAGVS